jgi:putative membrane protein insertion efficiency factor
MPERRPFAERVRHAPRDLLIGLVRGYRLLLSPWLGSACRFEPTCSVYALEALERHGAVHGGWLTTRRLARCHPFCAGGHDPVPPARPTPPGAMLRASSASTDPSDSRSEFSEPSRKILR